MEPITGQQLREDIKVHKTASLIYTAQDRQYNPAQALLHIIHEPIPAVSE